MSGVIMECEDLLTLKNSEIAALQEELQRERIRREAVESEADIVFNKLLQLQKRLADLQAKVNSWVQIADEQAAMKQQLERQGYEL